jgi:hypothetical protein
MRAGITGHQHLADESRWDWVRSALRSVCLELGQPLVGLSSLAVGADQLFATTVLELGGQLEVIVPFPEYPDRFSGDHARDAYDDLLSRASRIETLLPSKSDESGYLAAGQRIASNSDVLLAVWGGRPAKGSGGTADIVEFGRRIGRRVIHINPETATVQDR